MIFFLLKMLLLTGLLAACAGTKPYEQDSLTDNAVRNLTRYGVPLTLAGGAGFAGYELSKGNPYITGAGAAAGLAGGALLNVYRDAEEQKVWQAGVEHGEAKHNALELEDRWHREAVWGVDHPDASFWGEGQRGGNPGGVLQYRTEYVPPRTVNGVKLNGGYQSVPVYVP
ncbi:MAG: hypothetical protein LBK60_11415 [Verrucomicrobiales bacterium]|jgi:hypothetical protein|nr:hypothetical protein [Verrucomicrobiales bacterium]